MYRHYREQHKFLVFAERNRKRKAALEANNTGNLRKANLAVVSIFAFTQLPLRNYLEGPPYI
jgi:hypothetical protein